MHKKPNCKDEKRDTIMLVPMQTSGHMQILKIAHFLHIFPIVLAQKKYSRYNSIDRLEIMRNSEDPSKNSTTV